MATGMGETLHRSPQNRKSVITRERCEIRQKFVLNTNSKPWVGFPNPPLFWLPWQPDWAKRYTAHPKNAEKGL